VQRTKSLRVLTLLGLSAVSGLLAACGSPAKAELSPSRSSGTQTSASALATSPPEAIPTATPVAGAQVTAPHESQPVSSALGAAPSAARAETPSVGQIRSVVALGAAGRVQLWSDLAGTRRTDVPVGAGRLPFEVTWAPGGDYLAVRWTDSNSEGFSVIDAASRRVTGLPGDVSQVVAGHDSLLAVRGQAVYRLARDGALAPRLELPRSGVSRVLGESAGALLLAHAEGTVADRGLESIVLQPDAGTPPSTLLMETDSGAHPLPLGAAVNDDGRIALAEDALTDHASCAGVGKLSIYSPSSKMAHAVLKEPVPGTINGLAWAGSGLYVSVNSHCRSDLYRVAVETGRLDPVARDIDSFTVAHDGSLSITTCPTTGVQCGGGRVANFEIRDGSGAPAAKGSATVVALSPSQ